MSEELKYWYAVHTRPRWEKKIARLLTERGVENYCPLNKVLRKWSDRNKVVLEPLFRGYVFVRVEDARKWEITAMDGILNYVYWLGKPARLREDEIDTIRRFLNEFANIEVSEYIMQPNTEVLIKNGVLMNYRGVVLEVLGNKARVRIDSMGLQLSAVFDKSNLEPEGVLIG